MRYYVYKLVCPIKNVPFYIGVSDYERKQKGYRFDDHITEALLWDGVNRSGINPIKLNFIKKILSADLEPIVNIVFESDNLNDIFEKEKELISLYGRIDLKTGILTNLTDGGDGVFNLSDEIRSSIGDSRRGKSYEEIYGTKKANELKQVRTKRLIEFNKFKKDKTYEEIYGEYKAKEIKKKSSDSLQGRTPWNLGLSKDTDDRLLIFSDNLKRRMSGKTYEEIYGEDKAKEIKKKKSLTNKKLNIVPPSASGLKRSEEWKNKHSEFWSGKPKSKEQKKKISESLKGNVPWNKGKTGLIKQTNESNQKRSEALKAYWAKKRMKNDQE